MSAANAFIEMPAERGGTTPGDGQEHFDMLPGDPLTASLDESVSRGADQTQSAPKLPRTPFEDRLTVFRVRYAQESRTVATSFKEGIHDYLRSLRRSKGLSAEGN